MSKRYCNAQVFRIGRLLHFLYHTLVCCKLTAVKWLVVLNEIEHEDSLKFWNVNKSHCFKHCRIKNLSLVVFELKSKFFDVTQLSIIKLCLLIISNYLAFLIPFTVDNLFHLIIDIDFEKAVAQLQIASHQFMHMNLESAGVSIVDD